MDLLVPQPRPKESNREYACRVLRMNIMTFRLKPGEPLSEIEIAKLFQMSRTPVHEAITTLHNDWLIEIFPQRGTQVSRIDPALVKEGYSTRLLLEPGMAEMAALNASDEDIGRIQRLCDRVESKIHSGDLYIEDDIAFHTCIAESSKNMVVEQLIPIIDTAVMMFVNVTHKKLTEETILTHRMITEAIARHDPIGARSAMVMHLNFNRNCIRKLYDGEWET